MTIITLYRNCKIIPSKNFVVEDIETYLSSLTKFAIEDFQYLRNDLNLTIKINRSQEFSESLATNNYNYLKVSQGGVLYYYFIVKKTQVAQSTIALELIMDTLNTYKWGNAFTPSDRTKVIREHKDRIISYGTELTCHLSYNVISGSIAYDTLYNGVATYSDSELPLTIKTSIASVQPPLFTFRFNTYREYLKFMKAVNDNETITFKCTNPALEVSLSAFSDIEITNKSYMRSIDYYPEGVTPLLYKKDLGDLFENNFSWNLIYRNNENDPDAISCYCVPDKDATLRIPASSTRTYSDFEDGMNYIFTSFYVNGAWRQTIGYIEDDTGERRRYSLDATYPLSWLECVIVRRAGTHLYIRKATYTGYIYPGSTQLTNLQSRTLSDEVEIQSVTFERDLYYCKRASLPSASGTFPDENGQLTLTEQNYELPILSDIDRVDPKLIKIIKIPYFPSSISTSIDNEKVIVEVDATWTYESSVYNTLLLNDLNTRFKNTIVSSIDNPLKVFDLSINIDTSANRDDYFESKIYHSDFYQPKFVYDSFGFVFELEKIDEELFSPSSKFSFEFIMTSTINSKFLFKFPEYVLKLSTSDYDNILPVARNNEAPIYNSSYITYLRTAYRYDLKAFYQKEGIINFNATMGAIQSGVSIVEGGVKKDAMRVFSGLTNFASTLFNAINQRNTNEWNLEAKKEQLKNQANSVNGSDDLDLLESYSNNRAKLCLYSVSERMRNLLLDLFYYYGYATDEIKIPSTNTRYWFNFVSCELEFTGLDSNITEVAKANLIQRYKDGATFLHNHSGEWDFAQTKENWENSIL